MRRIVFAWELGGGLGHIQYDLPLAKKLQERGHEVICIMKHVIDAEKVFGQHGIKVLQAPVWQVQIKKLDNTFSYAETLFNQGYLIKGALLSMTKAWRGLFDIINPDLLIVDHAPTALIAARGTNIKVILYGTGFSTPPVKNPIPTIIPWVKTPKGLLDYSEKKAVDTINDVLKEMKAPLLGSLSDLFAVDENILATFSELDHYQDREKARYWGPVISLPEGESPRWPGQPDARKIFCYLKPNYPHLEKLLSCLQKIEASVIIYVKNTPDEIKSKFQSPEMRFVERPLDMNEVCADCHLVICHAGHGTIAVALLHGKPLMLLPEHNQLEQILTSQHVAKLHAGLVILTRQEKRDYWGGIQRLLSEPRYTEEAKKFARKYKEFDSAKQLEEIADRCEELMKSGTG